jgi:hypothetical protein
MLAKRLGSTATFIAAVVFLSSPYGWMKFIGVPLMLAFGAYWIWRLFCWLDMGGTKQPPVTVVLTDEQKQAALQTKEDEAWFFWALHGTDEDMGWLHQDQ